MAVFGMVMKGILVSLPKTKTEWWQNKIERTQSGTYNTLKTSNKNIGML